MIDIETYYDLLGVKETATPEEIKRAYHKMVELYHPDKVINVGPKLKKVAEDTIRELNKAKEVLLDPEKRSRYDNALLTARKRYEDINWEREVSQIKPPALLKCPYCGINNQPDHLFCKNCSRELARPKYRQPTQRQYVELTTYLEQARNKLDLVRSHGANISDVRVIIRKAIDAVKENEYDVAIQYAKQCIEFADKVDEYHTQTVNQIRKGWKMLQELKLIGGCTEKTERMIMQADKELKAGNYREAASFANASLAEAARAKSEYEKLAEVIKVAQSKLSKLKRAGAHVTAIEMFFNRIPYAMDHGEYENAIRLAQRCVQEANIIERRYGELSELMQIIHSTLGMLEADHVNTTGARQKFNRVTNLMRAGNYNEAIKLAKETAIETDVLKRRYQDVSSAIQKAKTKIIEAEVVGANVRKAEEPFNKIISAMRGGNYDKALEHAATCEAIAEKVRRLHCETIVIIKGVWLKIRELKSQGKDTISVEELLSKARKGIETGDYELALACAQQCMKEVQRL